MHTQIHLEVFHPSETALVMWQTSFREKTRITSLANTVIKNKTLNRIVREIVGHLIFLINSI